MQIVISLNFTYPRMMKMMGNDVMALVGKDVVGILAVKEQK